MAVLPTALQSRAVCAEALWVSWGLVCAVLRDPAPAVLQGQGGAGAAVGLSGVFCPKGSV